MASLWQISPNLSMINVPRMEWRSLKKGEKLRFAGVFGIFFVSVAMFNPPSRASLLMWITTQMVDGTVTRAADPNNHNCISYEYRVDRKMYTGSGYGPHHADLQQGQLVEISFFPPMPSQSVMVSKDEQWGFAIFGLIMGLLMGIFAACGDYWNRHRT